MDALHEDEVRRLRAMTPEEKLAEVLDLMAAGFLMMEAHLRRRYPDDSDDEIAARLADWALQDE